MAKWGFALLMFIAAGVLASADNGSDKAAAAMEAQLRNVPAVSAWNVWGAKATLRSDEAVTGGSALRVSVTKGNQPWDGAASTQLVKPVKKGDIILAAFWARTEILPKGKTAGVISQISVQMAKAPYTGLFGEPAAITGKWAMYYASGVADRDYDSKELSLTVQLAAETQTIDLGPAFVLDLGPDYDKAKLPHNKLAAASPRPAGPAVAVPDSIKTAESRYAGELAKLRAALPAKGTLINDPGILVSVYGAEQTNRVVDDPSVPGGKAVRVTMSKRGSDPWSDGASIPIYGDVHQGDAVLMAVYARAETVTNEAQAGVITSMGMQLTRSPWTALASAAASVPHHAWRVFYVSGIAQTDYPVGDLSASLQLGCCVQTLDIGPIFILNLGQGVKLSDLPANRISYPGRAENAPWRKAAEARIRKVRTGEMKLLVVDAGGKPVPGAKLHVAMKKHRFWFGGFAGYELTADTDRGAMLRKLFLSHFNFATSPIYWSDWGWENDRMRKTFLQTAKWLHENGYAWRGHPIVYPNETGTPGYVKKLAGDPAAVRKAVLGHVRGVVDAVKEYEPYCFDGFNEPRDGTYLPKIAGADIAADIFKTAHAAYPRAMLFSNEYGIASGGGMNGRYIDDYYNWIVGMRSRSAPVSGIGIQGHFGAQLTGMDRMTAILDRFSSLGAPVEITEFDVDTSDEQTQADYTRDMLTLVFSHPGTNAFVTWDWFPSDSNPRAMFRADGSGKPNAKVWSQLIYHDWWTDAEKTADASGKAALRAFYGDYEIRVSGGGKTATKNVLFTYLSAEPIKIVLE